MTNYHWLGLQQLLSKRRFSGLGSLFGYHEIQDKSGYNF